MSCSVRVVLPAHLKNLAHVGSEVLVAVPVSASPSEPAPVTRQALLDALESRFPMLLGTIRDQVTGQRRPFVRFYACEQDLSNEPADAPLPAAVATGLEPFLVVGAMAGG